jgi:hypothetical protein
LNRALLSNEKSFDFEANMCGGDMNSLLPGKCSDSPTLQRCPLHSSAKLASDMVLDCKSLEAGECKEVDSMFEASYTAVGSHSVAL